MKLIVFAAGLALAVAVPAAAQADPALAPATPEKLKLAQQVMDAAGGSDRVKTAIRTMMGTLYAGLEKNMPPEQARLTNFIQNALQEETLSIVPAVIQASEQIYAEDLTEKEMRDELAWLNSESGRSIRQKSPLMVQQIAQAEVPMIQAMMPRLGQRIIDRVCAEAKCSDHDRQVVASAMAKAMAAHPS